MAPSQLKRLKSSLREQGIVGPQRSKKQKKQAAQSGISKEKRVARNAALQGIREQFNPFEVKAPARPSKYEFANGPTKKFLARPGVTKSLGEETRRKTLLLEMHRRRKVGEIVDKRFGENDPTMTPEDRALERFVAEKQRGGKKASLYNLEDDEEEEKGLTHLGKSLSLSNGKETDDFDEEGLDVSEDGVDAEVAQRSRKRRRLSDTEVVDEDGLSEAGSDARPDKPKTKQEVMKEVIAKSKFHKYERQKAKEDDDDLRAELDLGLKDIRNLLRGAPSKANGVLTQNTSTDGPVMNPDRAALLNGKDRLEADKEYDERLRQMAFDARSKPTTRTKTDEEKLEEEAQRLKNLEEKRLARMRGEQQDEEDELDYGPGGDEDVAEFDEKAAGLGKGIPVETERKVLDVEDEDEFVLDDDLVASDSDLEASEPEDDDTDTAIAIETSDEEKEFVQGLLSNEDAGRAEFKTPAEPGSRSKESGEASGLPFTYQCPQTHDEFLEITESTSLQDLPTIVQRIRSIYHPKLGSENKAKLGKFSSILVEHLNYLANKPEHPSFTILGTLIRHIHSLAKSFPLEVGDAFRAQLRTIQEKRPTSPAPGDLVIYTAIGSIFPTSDHFHQVVTPAMLSMARYLGQRIPKSLADLAKVAYIGTLSLQYQRLSKRYVPEVVNSVLNGLYMLSPLKPTSVPGPFPYHEGVPSMRIGTTQTISKVNSRLIRFWDIEHKDGERLEEDEEVKISLLETYLGLVDGMAELWVGLSAYQEIFEPFTQAFAHLSSKSCISKLPTSTKDKLTSTSKKLEILIQQGRLNRKPLRLHNHRPLAIKMSIPKFEESYNPDKHYDPDRERTELSKLKAEHKRERKGALRELRKDANFIARESLREKKERDAQYEKKYKRLVAEIQGEEGREGNLYEREKRMRKGKR